MPLVGGGDAVVEAERIPREASARSERGGHTLEHASAVCPRGQVQQSAERAVDEARRLVQLEVPHVRLAEMKLDAGLGSALAGQTDHRGRGVDADDGATRFAGDGNRHVARADGELDQRPVRFAREVDIERNVLRHVLGPFVVDGRERVVRAHGGR